MRNKRSAGKLIHETSPILIYAKRVFSTTICKNRNTINNNNKSDNNSYK